MFSHPRILGFAFMPLCLLAIVMPLGTAFGDNVHTRPSTHKSGQSHGQHAQAPADQPSEFAGDPYLLDIDPVSSQPLVDGPQQVIVNHDGGEVRFNNQADADTFTAHPEKYLPAIDARLTNMQLPYYPLDTCVVSGEKLGEMQAPVNFIYRNRLIRFCCKMCPGKFVKDPAKFIAKLDEAVIARQSAAYPLKTCMLSHEALDSMGEPVKRVFGNRLVEFCCPHCIKKFTANPAKYFAQIDAAAREQGK